MSSEKKSRSLWKRLAIALIALVVLGLAMEGALRWVLFSDSDLARSTGSRLRRAWMYADRWNDDDYWYLDQRFRGEPGRLPATSYDPLLGWRSNALLPDGYDHVARYELDGRRPVLMYGDSFTMCMTEPEDCWEGLLDRSELGKRYKLVNYGMRGYGIDQAYLLLQKSLPLWKDLDPIVVFGIFLEDDLDRAWLTFRGWPKPYFRLHDTQLMLESSTLPFYDDEWLANYETDITSYLGRALTFYPSFPANARKSILGTRDLDKRIQSLSVAILDQTIALLKQNEVEFFFVLFHSEKEALELLPKNWREPSCIDSFTRNGANWVSSRRALQMDWLQTGRTMGEYYGRQGQLVGHFTPLGQRVVFGAIEDGLEGKYDNAYRLCTCEPGSYVALPDPKGIDFLRAKSPLCQHFGFEHAVSIELERAPCRLRWELGGRCDTFRASAVLPAAPDAEIAGVSAHISIQSAGKVLLEEQIVAGEPPKKLELRMKGRMGIDFIVQEAKTAPGVGRLLLGDVRFE